MQLDKLSRTDMQIAGSAALLVLSLLVFPWFSFSVGPVSLDLSGTSVPDGWLGVLSVLFAVATVADLLIERYSPQTGIPPLGGSREMTRFILASGAAACVALKFLLHIHFNDFGWGFYFTAIVAAGLVYSALEARRGPLT